MTLQESYLHNPPRKPASATSIFIMTTDDCNGHENQVFFDEELAEAYAESWCRFNWHPDAGPFPDDWRDAYDQISQGDRGWMWLEVHDIKHHPIIASAKAQLNDLLEQVYQMQGMFSDDDGRILQAVSDAENWPEV